MENIPPRHKRWKWLTLVAVAAFIGGWLVINAVAADKDDDKKKDGANKPQTVTVRTAPALDEAIAPQLTAVGNVIATQSVALNSRLNSQIVDVKFRAGGDVKAGDVLFVLDTRELQAQLGEVKAKLAGDQARLENLQKEYERQELGVEKGFSSKAARDVAKADYESQKALIQTDRASIENLKVQISYGTVTAPITGRTGTINATLGNNVSINGSVPLVVINQIKPISVEAALPQNSIDAVRAAQAGGPVEATAVTSTGKIVHGTLDYIDNAINTATGTFAARAVFPNDDETLWPGTLVNLNIMLGQGEKHVTVPEVAVQASQTGSFVYVIGQDGVAKHRDIKVIRIQNGRALVGEGLQTGETVAIDGMMSIKDGGKVQVAPAEASATPSAETSGAPTAPGASGLAPATSAPQDSAGAPNNAAASDANTSSGAAK